MKNKKIIRFLRFLKENGANTTYKKAFYANASVRYRKNRFNSRFVGEDISQMNLFQYLRYSEEKNVIMDAISSYYKPGHEFWFLLNLEWIKYY